MGLGEIAAGFAMKAIESLPLERIILGHREQRTTLDILEGIAKEKEETTMAASQSQDKPSIETKLPPITQEVAPAPEQEGIATACVTCALGHFSTSSGLLNEAIRFKEDGITNNEILDRIAMCLEEQNALERVDLTPERLQKTSAWEREIAEEALKQSRKLRHRLEGMSTIEELEQATVDATTYYKQLNRQWYKGRSAHLIKGKVETMESKVSPEDKERIREKSATMKEEKRWAENSIIPV